MDGLDMGRLALVSHWAVGPLLVFAGNAGDLFYLYSGRWLVQACKR